MPNEKMVGAKSATFKRLYNEIKLQIAKSILYDSIPIDIDSIASLILTEQEMEMMKHSILSCVKKEKINSLERKYDFIIWLKSSPAVYDSFEFDYNLYQKIKK